MIEAPSHIGQDRSREASLAVAILTSRSVCPPQHTE
jgi:hypothetical protein